MQVAERIDRTIGDIDLRLVASGWTAAHIDLTLVGTGPRPELLGSRLVRIGSKLGRIGSRPGAPRQIMLSVWT